jgi:hypothetical protein
MRPVIHSMPEHHSGDPGGNISQPVRATMSYGDVRAINDIIDIIGTCVLSNPPPTGDAVLVVL